MKVLSGSLSTMHLATACTYSFELRQKDGETPRVIIECVWPGGQRSRMSVSEEDWQTFIDGFLQVTGKCTASGYATVA